jgi:surface polysaccharide O-acyltransferase-like enzyme
MTVPGNVEGKAMSSDKECSVAGKRMDFLDNLKSMIIFLVILYHAGGVYESSGIWGSFWIVDDPVTSDLPGIFGIILDIFMMTTLFFVSGYLAPASLKSKTGWTFIKTKLTRLMLPWLVAVFTLIPLYQIIFLYSRGLPQDNWATYFHFADGLTSQNWLWFLPLLFLFNAVYLLGSKLKLSFPNISFRAALVGAVLIGFAYSVGMDLGGVRGWTKTAILDFQNERILIYFMAFLLGSLCFKQRMFDAPPRGMKLYILVQALSWIPIMAYIVFLLYPLFYPGSFIISEIAHSVIRWFCFHLSLLCLVYSMVETFRRYGNKQGKFRRALSRNSYYVYIIHVIVMGGFATAMLNLPVPALTKYVLLTIATFVTSNVIVTLIRTVSSRKRIHLPNHDASLAKQMATKG